MKNLKTAPTRKEKKLQKEIDGLRGALAATREDNDLQRTIKARYIEEAGQLAKKLEHVLYANDSLAQRIGELERHAAQSDEARRVSAEGMSIERDELQARAARLEMRIQGLGFPAR